MKPQKFLFSTLLAAAALISVPAFAEDSTGTTWTMPTATITFTSGIDGTSVSSTRVKIANLTGTTTDGSTVPTITDVTTSTSPTDWIGAGTGSYAGAIIEFTGTATGEQSIAKSLTAGGYGGIIGLANNFVQNSNSSYLPGGIIISGGLELDACYVQNRGTNGADSAAMTFYFDNASLYSSSGTTFAFKIGVGDGGLRLSGSGSTNYVYSGAISGTGNIYICTGSGVAYTSTFSGDTSGFTGTWIQSNGTRTYIFGTGTQTYTSVGGNFGISSSRVNLKFNYNSDYTVAGDVYANNLEVAKGNATFSGTTKDITTLNLNGTSATFTGTSTIGTLNANAGTSSFGAGTITTANLSGTSASFTGTQITTLNVNAGTATFDGDATITTANVGGDSATFTGTQIGELNVFAGTVNYTGNSSEITTVTLSGGETTFAGTTTITNLAGEAGTLKVAENATVTLTGTHDLATTIENAGTVSLASTLTFILDGNDVNTNEDNVRTYTLISNTGAGTIDGWSALTRDNFQYENAVISSRKDVDLKTAGVVVISGTVANLVWAGTADSTWNNEKTNTVWVDSGTTNANYFLTSDNVTFDNSAENKTVVLAENVSAKSVTFAGGEYTLTASDGAQLTLENGNSVVVSEGAKLTLGTSGAIDSSIGIEVNGTLAMDAMLPTNKITGSGTVALSNNSENTVKLSTANLLSGNVSVEITGTGTYEISVAQDYTGGTILRSGNLGIWDAGALGTGTLTMEGGKLTTDSTMTFSNNIHVAENSTLDTLGTTFTLSGNLTVDEGKTLTKTGTTTGGYTGGTLKFSGNIHVDGTLEILAGTLSSSVSMMKSVYINKLVLAAGTSADFTDWQTLPTTVLNEVEMGEGTTLKISQTFNSNTTTPASGQPSQGATVVNKIALTGTTGTVEIPNVGNYFGAWVKINALESAAGTDATLYLKGNQHYSNVGTFEFSGDATEGAFTGTLNVTSGSSNGFVGLVISNDKILENAVVSYGSLQKGGILAVNTDHAVIAGLSSTTSTVDVFAGTFYAKNSGTQTAHYNVSSIHKTLEINTAENQTYTFAGNIAAGTAVAGLHLVKSGAGTQIITGTVNTDRVQVDAGTLKLSGTTTISGFATVNAGTLELAGTATISNLTVASGASFVVDKNATVTLNGTIDLAGTVTNSGTINVATDAIFVLDNVNVVDNGDGSRTYTVLSGTITVGDSGTGTWADLKEVNFSKDGATLGSRQTITDISTTAGTVTISGVVGIIWNGKDGTQWDSSSNNWKTKATNSVETNFQTDDNVYFTADVGIKSVEVTGTIKASSLVVQGGEYTISIASDESDSLTVGNVQIDAGAQLTFDASASGKTTIENGITNNGTLVFNYAPTNTIGGNGTVKFNNDTETEYTLADSVLTNDSTLEKTGSGTVVISAAQNHAGGTTIKAGTLAFEDAGAFGHGAITLEAGTLEARATGLDLANNINVTGDAAIAVGTNTLTVSGTLSVDENKTLRKTGAGTLNLDGNVAVAGTLDISAGTTASVSGYAVSNFAAVATIGVSESLNINNLKIAENLAFKLNDKNALPESKINTLTLADGAIFEQYSSGIPAGSLVIDNVVIDGDGSTGNLATEGYGAGWKINGLTGSGTLNLLAGHTYIAYSIYEFAGDATESAFTGTVNLKQTQTGDFNYRHSAIVISNEKILSGAVIDFAQQGLSTAQLALAVNAEKVTIAGLQNSSNATLIDVFSGSVNFGANNDGTSLYLKSITNNTLEICTADEKSYEFSGRFLDNINLEKSGAGTQILSGESTDFAGTVTVSAGTLELASTLAIGTQASVEIGTAGTLSLRNDVSVKSIAGTGTLAKSTNATDDVTMMAGTASFTGTIGAGVSLVVETLTSTLAVSDGASLTVQTGNQGRVSGNNGTVNVESAATLTLAGTNAGTVNVQNFGTLVVNTASLGTIVGEAKNSTIELTQTVTSGEIKISSSGNIYIANGFDSADVPAATNDLMALDAGTVDEANRKTINIIAESALKVADSATGTLVTVSDWADCFYYDETYYLDAVFAVDSATQYITLTYTIPEPSLFGLLAGTLALALAGTRRRRRK